MFANLRPYSLRELGFPANAAKGLLQTCFREATATDFKKLAFDPRLWLDGPQPLAKREVCEVYDVHHLLEAGLDKAEVLQLDPRKQDQLEAHRRKQRGATALQLRLEGLKAETLRAAGFDAAKLKEAGFTAAELRRAGFYCFQLRSAGFGCQELKQAECTAFLLRISGWKLTELHLVGFTAKQLTDGGFPLPELLAAGCTEFTALELAEAGAELSQLKEVGFGCKDLSKAGFSASQMREAGFSMRELGVALGLAKLEADGFRNVQQLIDAGFDPHRLKKHGYTAKMMLDAGVPLQDLIEVFHVSDLAAQVIPATLLTVVSKKKVMRAGCYSLQKLREAGFSAKELRGELGDRRAPLRRMREAGFTLREMATTPAGCRELKHAGFDLLQEAHLFTREELVGAGYSDEDVLQSCCRG